MVYGPSNPLPKTIELSSKHPAIIGAVVSVCVHVHANICLKCCLNCLPILLGRMCVYSFQSRHSSIYVLSVLPLTCVAWAVYSCVLMWLPVGIYGISSICQLSQQVHPISQIHSCESKGELWLNNVILLIQLFKSPS